MDYQEFQLLISMGGLFLSAGIAYGISKTRIKGIFNRVEKLEDLVKDVLLELPKSVARIDERTRFIEENVRKIEKKF